MDPVLDSHRRHTEQPDPQAFLRHFPGSQIQYFDDSKTREPRKAIGSPEFDRVEADRRQRRGCGVYFSPNAFVAHRRTESLRQIQAVFLDLDCGKEGDGQPIAALERRKSDALLALIGSRCIPHVITETKNGLQPLWRVRALDVETGSRLFREAMEVLLRRFGGDPAVKDPVRVLRLPGYLHLKDPSRPFRCSLLWNELRRDAYELQALIDELYLPPRFPPEPANLFSRPSNLPEIAPIEDVIREAAREAGIAVEFRRNRDGSRQIIEDGRITSGFVSSRQLLLFRERQAATGRPPPARAVLPGYRCPRGAAMAQFALRAGRKSRPAMPRRERSTSRAEPTISSLAVKRKDPQARCSSRTARRVYVS